MAGWTVDETVAQLNRQPERFRFNRLPKPGVVTKGWVLSRMRDLRKDIEATSRDD